MPSGLFIFLSSCALALGATPIVRGFARKQGGEIAKIPRLGGAAIFFAFCLPLVLLPLISPAPVIDQRLLLILAGGVLVLLIGVYDDIHTASVGSRLAIEVAAACLVCAAGIRMHALPNPLGAPLQLGWLSFPATVLWIVVITNAINLIDGLDGLAAGSAILILTTVLLLNFSQWHGVQFLAIFSLLGALTGFLAYNFPPASIYMGDSGSLFLGFFLSSFALTALPNAREARLIGITALAFSIPLLDMAYAILRRWYRGVSICSSDRDHLHHKLLQKGLSQRRVVLLFYAANLFLMLMLVFLLRMGSKSWITFSILFILSFAAFAAFQFLSDLSPGEFIGKILLLFRSFRRMRYHLYLINRFERRTERKRQFEGIRADLDDLFRDYGLHAAEIHSRQGPVYFFGSREKAEAAVSYEFPLLSKGTFLGRVRLQKELSGEHLLCSGELADSLSACLDKLLAELPNGSPPGPDDGNER